jgi:uncharacterized membrane protein YgcG
VLLTLAIAAMIAAGLAGSTLTASASPRTDSRPLVAQAQENVPERYRDSSVRVHDRVDILTDEQESTLENDMQRASGLGVEMLVYTRMSDDDPEQSQQFADELRTQWEVESEDGADNGIVYLITVNPAEPDTNSILISSGSNTFPWGQLDQDTMQGILDNEMAPLVDDGDFSESVYFGVRRVLNYMEYSPPDPASRTNTQETLNAIAGIAGSGLAQVTVLGFFVVPAIRERRLTLMPSTKSLAMYAIIAGVLAVLVGIIAIAGRNGAASLASLAVVVWAAFGVPLLIEFLDRRQSTSSDSHVSTQSWPTSIPPGTDAKQDDGMGRAHG